LFASYTYAGPHTTPGPSILTLLCFSSILPFQAAKWGVSRHEQDEFAALSHQRAAKAHQDGMYKEEIVPVDGNVMENGIKVRNGLFFKRSVKGGVNGWREERGSTPMRACNGPTVAPLDDNVFAYFVAMTVSIYIYIYIIYIYIYIYIHVSFLLP
jgi:hypothetical protein